MTNTMKRPIKCGFCSTFTAPVYHDGTDGVRACAAKFYGAKAAAPKVEVPETPAPAVAVPAEAKVITPGEVKVFGRWSAKCYKKDCTTAAVKDHPFVLRCSNHGAKPVRVKAKQLKGQFSDSPKHRCNDACLFAVGAVCTCSCGGAGHGIGHLKTVVNVG